ncbi:MAG: hypothetical protein ACKVOB_06525 [Sphingomonas sp.]
MTERGGMVRVSRGSALLGARRQRIAQYFMAQHALSAADATLFRPLSDADAQELAAMRARGMVREAIRDHYYLDLATYDAVRERMSRQAVLMALALSVGIAIVLMFFYTDAAHTIG